MLEGKKVVLRSIKKSDAKIFSKWFNNLEITQYLMAYLPMTEAMEQKWIEDLGEKNRGKDIVFAIEVKIKGRRKTIGTCGLHQISWKDRDAEFGIMIGDKKFWSDGHGTEAARLIIEYGFNHLNLHRISSAAFSFNERSLGLHKKLGFKKEGCVRESIFKNGKYCDKILFGILREEWNK